MGFLEGKKGCYFGGLVFCVFKETSISGLTFVMRLRFCGVVTNDCSNVLLRRVPFPGELSCIGFPEKKSRNTGKLSLKHLQMLRGLPFLADTVAALLHPRTEVL